MSNIVNLHDYRRRSTLPRLQPLEVRADWEAVAGALPGLTGMATVDEGIEAVIRLNRDRLMGISMISAVTALQLFARLEKPGLTLYLRVCSAAPGGPAMATARPHATYLLTPTDLRMEYRNHWTEEELTPCVKLGTYTPRSANWLAGL